jgi:hypothetical protein
VTRDGDTWRAEASLGAGGELPIAGVAGAGIPSTALPEGAAATITGIVRRAHPAATDQRFAVVPRSKDDIRVGATVRRGDDDDGEPGPGGDGGADGGGAVAGVGAGADGDASSPQVATFASLAEYTDHVVRVGGRLERAEGARLHLHDGTASGVVRLPDDAIEFGASLAVGEVINVTGRVRDRGSEPPEVVARSMADIQRAASLPAPGEASPPPAGDLVAAALVDEPSDLDGPLAARSRPVELPNPVLAAAAAILVGAVLAAAGAVGFIVWRRRTSSMPEPLAARPNLLGR